MEETIEVVVSSEAFVRWAREVTETAERLRILLDNMPREAKAAVACAEK